MRTYWLIPVFAALLLTGCGDMLSVESLANKTNTVFDPALLGTWSSEDAVAIVQAGDEQSYRIHWMDADVTGNPKILELEGRLAKIGGQQILDITAAEPGAFTIPAHAFVRVRQKSDGLYVQFVDAPWLQEKLKSSGLAAFAFDGHPVITGPASQVEAFLVKFGLDEKALGDPMIMRPFKKK